MNTTKKQPISLSAPAAKAKRKRPLSTFDQRGEKKEKNGFCFENHFGDTFIVPPKEENNIITVIPQSHPKVIAAANGSVSLNIVSTDNNNDHCQVDGISLVTKFTKHFQRQGME